jgi:hypothetical protein
MTPTPAVATPRWIGWTHLHLVHSSDTSELLVETAVRVDHLTLWLDHRTLAVIDRDRIRQWLGHAPRPPLETDDFVWEIVGSASYLTIDSTATCVIDRVDAAHLFTAIR